MESSRGVKWGSWVTSSSPPPSAHHATHGVAAPTGIKPPCTCSWEAPSWFLFGVNPLVENCDFSPAWHVTGSWVLLGEKNARLTSGTTNSEAHLFSPTPVSLSEKYLQSWHKTQICQISLQLLCVSQRGSFWRQKPSLAVPSGAGTLFSLQLRSSVLPRWLYLPLKRVVHAFRGSHYLLPCFYCVLFCLDQATAARNLADGRVWPSVDLPSQTEWTGGPPERGWESAT